MANYDNPNGFKPFGSAPMNPYTASATVTKGDLVTISSGKVLPFASGTHTDAIGVAAHNAVADGSVLVFDDPGTLFVGQCSGTYALTLDGEPCSVEGSTGAQEVDEDGTTGVVTILRHFPVPGSEDVGANSRVLFAITRHLLAPMAGGFDSMQEFAHIADISTAAVGQTANTGSADKTDVDTAFSAYDAKINAILARLEAAGINATS